MNAHGCLAGYLVGSRPALLKRFAERLQAANGSTVENGQVVDTKGISEAALLSDEDKDLLLAHASTDVPVVQDSYMYGGYRALTLTAYVPAMMAIGFLILLIYYRLQGGYKVLTVNSKGEVVESEITHGGGEKAAA